MRKFLFTLAAAVSAVAVAAPASAQVRGNLGVGYGAPYGNAYGYGYNNGYNRVERLQNQIQQVRYQMRNLAVQGRLTRAEARPIPQDRQRTIDPWPSRRSCPFTRDAKCGR